VIVVSLCVVPWRRHSGTVVLDSILRLQTRAPDRVHVWLNGFDSVPDGFPQDPRVSYCILPENPGPWVRYRAAGGLTAGDLFVTLDDDLGFPPGLLERGCHAVEDGGGAAARTVGAIKWDWCVPRELLEYGKDRRVLLSSAGLEGDRVMGILMGGAAFHRGDAVAGLADADWSGFETNDDLFASAWLMKKGVKIVAIGRPEGWIVELPEQSAPESLWRQDAASRPRAFRRLMADPSFQPCVRSSPEKGRTLAVMNGTLPPDFLSKLRKSEFEGVQAERISTLEVWTEGEVAIHGHRPMTEVDEHQVIAPDEGGRFECVPGVKQARAYRVRWERERLLHRKLAWLLRSRCFERAVVIPRNGQWELFQRVDEKSILKRLRG
jgi:hypothetical protein